MFRPREGAWHTPVIWPNVFSLGWGTEGDLIKLKMPRAAPTAGCLIISQKSLGLSSRTDIIIEFYPEKPGIEAACHITWYPKISCSSDVRSVPLSFTWFLWFTEIPLYKMRDVIRLQRKSVVTSSFEDWICSTAKLFLWLFWSQNEKKKKRKKVKIDSLRNGAWRYYLFITQS